MIQLGTNAKLRRLMGEAAHQRIKENFGWEKHIDEWESLYTSLKK
jgi:glycosyltransferase involved in cell wall biosynthesis